MTRKTALALLLGIAVLVSYYRFGYALGPDPFKAATYAKSHVATDTLSYQNYLQQQIGPWGLGKKMIAYSSLDRPYPWYIDQGDTGLHSGDNCGPSVLAMAVKYYHEEAKLTANWARLLDRPLGGWWYVEDIEEGLDRFKVPFTKVAVTDAKTLVERIRGDQLLILCNQMASVPKGNPNTREHNANHRVGRFYDYGDGHFLIVKGFVQVDRQLYFQVYDSNTWGTTYSDGSPMGRDRYYPAEGLVQSILTWYPYAYAISKP